MSITIFTLFSPGWEIVGFEEKISEDILIALRRIVRAIDLHSRRLAEEYGLTGPQVVLLREVVRGGEIHVAELAKNISLSHATVTDILNRLERRELIVRTRSVTDRRRILVHPTEQAVALVNRSPPLLQERFEERLARLHHWERAQILSVLQRVASMMDARQIDASPVMATGSVTAEAETVEMVTRSTLRHATGTAEPARADASQIDGTRPGVA
ncbi:MAG: MarR family transcriptional regulator [Nitrospirota bacterium]